MTADCIDWSNFLRMLFFLASSLTSEPKALSMPASSTAMYPLPTIMVFFGLFVNSKKSSEVMPNSAPGISGTIGAAPQAIMIYLAARRMRPTLISFER